MLDKFFSSKAFMEDSNAIAVNIDPISRSAIPVRQNHTARAGSVVFFFVGKRGPGSISMSRRARQIANQGESKPMGRPFADYFLVDGENG